MGAKKDVVVPAKLARRIEREYPRAWEQTAGMRTRPRYTG